MRSARLSPLARRAPAIRIRLPFTIVWTALCVIVAVELGGDVATPVSPECRDMCGLTSMLARFGIGLVFVVWLVVTVVAAVLWTWATRVRCPRCRKVVEPPVRFCPNCGHDLLQDIASSRTEPPGER